MKGTLYSADFIKDSEGNLRLNEFNTDTSFTVNAMNTFDLQPFSELLVSESISEVHVIHKGFQQDVVDFISTSLEILNYTGSWSSTIEDDTTIYPTDVEDAADKFILRMAYNESAIFDSTYCKSNINLFQLYTDNNDSGSVLNHYVSSSDSEYVYDNLNRTFNTELVPDVVWKAGAASLEQTSLSLYKIGSSSLSDNDRYSAFIDDIYTDGDLISNYVDTSNGGDRMKAIRFCNIIYGSDLQNLVIGGYEVESIFDKPTGSIDYDADTLVNPISNKHYFEFTTNYFKYNWRNLGGIFQDTLIQKEDGTFVSASQVVVDDKYVSLHISGSPSNDVLEDILAWSHTGSNFPYGSYVTSSVLISTSSHDIVYNTIPQIMLSGSEADFFLGPNMLVLVHDQKENSMRFKRVYDLNYGVDMMIGSSGSLIPIEELNMVVLDGDYKTYEFNVENDDTFIMNDVGVKVVGHNLLYGPSCFIAGTEITMANGDVKNIEDVIVGDGVLTYNEESGENEEGTVGDLKEHQVESVIRLTLDNENIIITTQEHPFYINGKGWVKAGEIEVLDTCRKINGEESLVSTVEVLEESHTVYNLLSVSENHNFFANGILVHNK